MGTQQFKIGTFNLYNLVLPKTRYYRDSEYTQAEYDRKITWIGQQLTAMNAQIVGFQEVFHEQALREALAASEVHQATNLMVADPASKTDPAVALASTFPILDAKTIKQFPATAQLDVQGMKLDLDHFSRPVLSARIQLSAKTECTVVVVHLKSKRPILPDGVDWSDPVELAKGQSRSLILRAAEATALRMVLMEVLQGSNHPVIVLGDINDDRLAVTSQIIAGEPPLPHFSTRKKKAIWDTILYPVKDIQARRSYGDFYYTHLHNGHYESLDHIMVSQEFVAQNPKRVGKVRYVSVFNDHLIDDTLGLESIPTWQSDHGQVVAAIELEKSA